VKDKQKNKEKKNPKKHIYIALANCNDLEELKAWLRKSV